MKHLKHYEEGKGIELISVDALKPNPENPRTHSIDQIAQIAAAIREFGFTSPLLITEDRLIIAGHGRLKAAKQLKLNVVPCLFVEDLTPEQQTALTIGDNRIAELSGWDDSKLTEQLNALLKTEIEMPSIGYTPEQLDELLTPAEELSSNYSRKIKAPIYEPKGEKPTIGAMIDTTKAEKLIKEIQASKKLPDDIKQFLIAAAGRHTRFNYRQIAEFYAHADAETQTLMENSALVIIDYEKAIEQGFIKVTSDMMAATETEEGKRYA